MDKQEARVLLSKKRHAFQGKERQLANQIVSQKIVEKTKDFQHIGLFISFGDEVDTKNIIELLLHQNKNIYVPKCSGKTLTFHEIHSISECVPSKFNLLEPQNEAMDCSKIEIFFIPLLGYDNQNHRLGYGRGYYDSILSTVHALKVGVAFQCQRLDEIPVEPHDVILDEVITN